MEIRREVRNEVGRWLGGLGPSLKLLGLIIAFFIAQVVAEGGLLSFALRPRELAGLDGILFAPLLHGGIDHLLSNLAALLVLLPALYSDEDYTPRSAIGTIWLLGGIGTWLIGRTANHLGASGLAFGLITYLIVSSFFLRTIRAALIGSLVLISYGALLRSVAPTVPWISWEGHLCGALAGAWAAYAQLSAAEARTKKLALVFTAVLAFAACAVWVVGFDLPTWGTSAESADERPGSGHPPSEEERTRVDEDYLFSFELPPAWSYLPDNALHPDGIIALRTPLGRGSLSVSYLPDSEDPLECNRPLVGSVQVGDHRDFTWGGYPARECRWSHDATGKVAAQLTVEFVRDDYVYSLMLTERENDILELDGLMLTFLDALSLLPGSPRTRVRAIEHQKSSGPAWVQEGGRLQDTGHGFDYEAPPGWRYLTSSELNSVDQELEFGLTSPTLESFVFVYGMRADDAAGRIAAVRTNCGLDRGEWSLAPDPNPDDGVTLHVRGVEEGLALVCAVQWHGRRGMAFLLTWPARRHDEFPPDELTALTGGLKLLSDAEHRSRVDSADIELLLSSDIAADQALRGGTFRRFSTGLRLELPRAAWLGVRESGSERLALQAKDVGLTVFVEEWAADEGEGLSRAHGLETSHWDDHVGPRGGTSLTIDGYRALSSSRPGEQVVTVALPDRVTQLWLEGNPADMDATQGFREQLIDGLSFGDPREPQVEYDESWEDGRLGFAVDSPSRSYEFTRFGGDTKRWNPTLAGWRGTEGFVQVLASWVPGGDTEELRETLLGMATSVESYSWTKEVAQQDYAFDVAGRSATCRAWKGEHLLETCTLMRDDIVFAITTGLDPGHHSSLDHLRDSFRLLD